MKVDSNTSTRDLSNFFQNLGDGDRIRAKQEDGYVMLYVRDRSLLDVLKENLSSKHMGRVADNRRLAQDTILRVLHKEEGFKFSHHRMNNIYDVIGDIRHDIRPAELRSPLAAIDKNLVKLGISVQSGWHNAVNRLMADGAGSEHNAIQSLQNLGRMQPADKEEMVNFILQGNSRLDPEDIRQDCATFEQFLQQQGATTLDRINYPRIASLAESWDLATKNNPDAIPTSGPLIAAGAFLSEVANPRITPVSIELLHGNLTENDADVFVMTSGMSEADKNVFKNRPEAAFVDALSSGNYDSFNQGVTSFDAPKGLAPSKAHTVFAAHCKSTNMNGPINAQNLKPVYREISASMKQWRGLEKPGPDAPSFNSILLPPLGFDNVNKLPYEKAMKIMAEEVLKMRTENPGLLIKILVPASLAESNVNEALQEALSRQRKLS